MGERYDYYLQLMGELMNTVRTFSEMSMELEDLIPSNILVTQDKQLILKVLFDERDKSYDRVKEG